MNEANQRHSVVVGLFVVFGLAILVSGVLLLGNLNKKLQDRTKIVAYIDDVSGLQKGNYIWFYGVRVGTVNHVRLRGAEGVEVVMDIDAKVTQFIHRDAKVKLGTDGFIGNRILIIYDGTPTEPTVEEGDTLKFEKTLSTEDLISTLQANNENLKAITGDFKIISKKLAEGEGTVGKLLNDDSFYEKINSAASSLQSVSAKAQQLISSLNEYSQGLKKEGTVAYELVSDTTMFTSFKASIARLNQIADTASLLINNLKAAESNSKTPIGTLLHNEDTGEDLRQTIKNLEITTIRLNEDLEGLQHSFPLKRYFKKKAKASGQ